MRRVKVTGSPKDAKRQMNRAGEEESPVVARKPGLESPVPHIALLKGLSEDMVQELTRHLLPQLQGRLGARSPYGRR